MHDSPASTAVVNAPEMPATPAVAAAANAPVIMTPSRPMLTMPARSTMVSPNAARASGVAVRIVASRNGLVASVTTGLASGHSLEDARSAAFGCGARHRRRTDPGTRSSPKSISSRMMKLDNRGQNRRYASVPLHRGSACLQRAEQDAAHGRQQWVERADESDRDGGVAIPRG